jgi:hypothetical protein
MTILKDRVRELRPLFVSPDPCGHTEYRPGELAQWDLWFPPAPVLLEDGSMAKPPVLVGVSGYSRVMVAEMIPSREAPAAARRHRDPDLSLVPPLLFRIPPISVSATLSTNDSGPVSPGDGNME